MSDPLFYCQVLPGVGQLARLQDDEARHASASRRLVAGDTLWLFDGRGTVARARFQARARRGTEVEAMVEERRQVPRPRPPVHLVCALPKGDRAAVLLDMATQLGLGEFTPLLCERGVVKPGEGTLLRLRRVCLEACKQSRRAHVPEIHAPATLDDIAARGGTLWIAHPDGESIHEVESRIARSPDDPLTIVVGPEGGFSDDERARATALGFTRVSLGAGILRVETAAVALLANAMREAIESGPE